MAKHRFNPEIAKKVGVNAAVIYENFKFWCSRNAKQGRNLRDGRAWYFASRTDLCKLFPYFSDSQVRTAIEKLVASELVIRGEYNLANYDKTSWYSVSESADWVRNAIGEKSPMDRSEIANRLVENRRPIPDKNNDNNHSPKPPEGDRLSAGSEDQTQEVTLVQIEEGFREFWDKIWPGHERKAKEPDCAKIYRKACEGKHRKAAKVSPDGLNAATRRYIISVRDRKYLRAPLGWLSDGDWELFLNAATAPESNEHVPYYRRVLEAQKTGRLV